MTLQLLHLILYKSVYVKQKFCEFSSAFPPSTKQTHIVLGLKTKLLISKIELKILNKKIIELWDFRAKYASRDLCTIFA